MFHCQKSSSSMIQISRHFRHFHSKMIKFCAGKIQFSTNLPPKSSNSSSMENKKIDEMANSNSVEQFNSPRTIKRVKQQSTIYGKSIDPQNDYWEPNQTQMAILSFIGKFNPKEDIRDFRFYNRHKRLVQILHHLFWATVFVLGACYLYGVIEFFKAAEEAKQMREWEASTKAAENKEKSSN